MLLRATPVSGSAGMLKLAIVALVCARALALPAAPDTALTPPDLERTLGPKCCECGADSPNVYKETVMKTPKEYMDKNTWFPS